MAQAVRSRRGVEHSVRTWASETIRHCGTKPFMKRPVEPLTWLGQGQSRPSKPLSHPRDPSSEPWLETDLMAIAINETEVPYRPPVLHNAPRCFCVFPRS